MCSGVEIPKEKASGVEISREKCSEVEVSRKVLTNKIDIFE